MGKKNDKRRGNNKRVVDAFPNIPKLVLVPHEPPPPQNVIQRNFTLYTQLTTNPSSPDLHLEFPTAMRQHIRQRWTKIPNPNPIMFETVDMSAVGIAANSPTPHSDSGPSSSAVSQPVPVPMRNRYGPIRTVEEVVNSLANPWRAWMSVQSGVALGERRQNQRCPSFRVGGSSARRSLPGGGECSSLTSSCDVESGAMTSNNGSQSEDQSEHDGFRDVDGDIYNAVTIEIERYKKLIQEVKASNHKLSVANEIIGISLLIDRQRPFNIGLREMSSNDFANFVCPVLASLNS